MGRAQQKAQATDVFVALMGARRGLGDVDLTAAHLAMGCGDYGLALQAVDEGAPDLALIDRLADRLAADQAQRTENTVTLALGRAQLLRPSVESADGGRPLPVFKHSLFVDIAAGVLAGLLQRSAGERRGAGALRCACDTAVVDAAYRVAANYLRSGCPEHLRTYFGPKDYARLRGRVLHRSGISGTGLGAHLSVVDSLLRDAISGEWVAFVCEHPWPSASEQLDELAQAALRVHAAA